jgi:hypothetical protein
MLLKERYVKKNNTDCNEKNFTGHGVVVFVVVFVKAAAVL